MAQMTRRKAAIWTGAALSVPATEAVIGPLTRIGDELLTPSRSEEEEAVARFLQRIHYSEPNVAHAGFPQVVLALSAVAAVCTILEYLGIRPSFGANVAYAEASNCKENFEKAESSMRHSGMSQFTDVERSPHNKEVSYLAAKKGGYVDDAMAATQYGGDPAFALKGPDPTIVEAATKAATKEYRLSDKDLASSLAFTDKKVRQLPDPRSGKIVPVMTFYNYLRGFICFTPSPPTSSEIGILGIHVPGFNEPDQVLIASLCHG